MCRVAAGKPLGDTGVTWCNMVHRVRLPEATRGYLAKSAGHVTPLAANLWNQSAVAFSAMINHYERFLVINHQLITFHQPSLPHQFTTSHGGDRLLRGLPWDLTTASTTASTAPAPSLGPLRGASRQGPDASTGRHRDTATPGSTDARQRRVRRWVSPWVGGKG